MGGVTPGSSPVHAEPQPQGRSPRGAGRRGIGRLTEPFRQEGAKGVGVAVLSTIVVVGAVVFVVLHSQNWPKVKEAFFSGSEFRDTFPTIAKRFTRNIEYFLIAEVFILAFALLLAVLRSLPGPVFFPLRAMAIVYTDLFRGIPTLLLVYLMGFGIPSLGLRGVPISATFWAVTALILSYSAYVAEVYRAGIDSVHPSQAAAARSLGLSRVQTLRYVVIPQAVRRVVPPLLNDFVGLQKDTALVSVVVVVPEAFKQAQISQNADFNFTPLLGAALLFLVITIPMTRLVDWLIGRERSRRQGGTVL
jgi:polar amino acid transport system permease protein